ncbi:hypothetical protein F4809DRAFT_528978 [Biscogniauxia mediterranea]|nr:hypothetical protein F4809DRAFT_528978 [Biscogniauxia mediterranea]
MDRQLVKNDGADLGTCPIGSVYYKCKLNNFDGCCRADPCANPGPSPCKDEDSPSITPTSTSKTMDNDSTTSDATSTESPTTHASSVTGTTLVTSVLSTTDATGGPSAITETVSLPSPTGVSQGSDSSPSSSSSSLSKGEVVGASIGGTIGALALLLIIFLLIRRHRISKRMSSTRGNSPTFFDEKSVIDQTQSTPKGNSGENDVFAPFGGRANSQEVDRPSPTSRPGYIELDANDAEKVGSGKRPVSELPLTPKQGSSSPGSSQFHPSPLTPGQPGTQMEIQNQLKAENGNYAEVNDDATVDSHRATLNATKNERANGYHALSWNNP